MARERLHSSLIAEMIRLVVEHKAISFTAGEPSAELFPLEELATSVLKAFKDPALFSYYPHNEGLLELREWIAAWMHADGLLPKWVTAENVLLTNGSQEGISLATEALIDEGDLIALESPTYPEAILTFVKQGARFAPVAVDKDGILPASLEEVLNRNNVKFLYTIVSFQNPTGCTTSTERRRKILELCHKFDVIILEDDPYHHLRYEGKAPESYLSLAGDDARVLYLGSFSKIVAPGVRCGWTIAPSEVMSKLAFLRVANEISLPAAMHYALFDFLKNQSLDSHLGRLQDVYRTRRNALVAALERHVVPLGLTFDVPEGGLFLWGRISGLNDMVRFARFAVETEKIGIIPGTIFFPTTGEGLDTIRFSFAKVTPEMAEEGALRLARALRTFTPGKASGKASPDKESTLFFRPGRAKIGDIQR
jgi:2-aminoadipate transaminase